MSYESLTRAADILRDQIDACCRDMERIIEDPRGRYDQDEIDSLVGSIQSRMAVYQAQREGIMQAIQRDHADAAQADYEAEQDRRWERLA